MMPPESIQAGATYQFNKAKAFVVEQTAETIIWREVWKGNLRKNIIRLSKELRRTPRWYFEKHASDILFDAGERR
jgi:hypothetical protein